jgi:hypothetical protein
MDDVNVHNIPAYQRKRSISARARKKPSYLKPAKKTRARPKMPTIEELSIQNDLPSKSLFPDPIIDDEIIESRPINEVREMKICGECDGYFDSINVAIIKVSSALREGDRILFESMDGLFEQTINSMQIDRKDVSLARAGSDIGLKVAFKPKVGTNVYKVI